MEVADQHAVSHISILAGWDLGAYSGPGDDAHFVRVADRMAVVAGRSAAARWRECDGNAAICGWSAMVARESGSCDATRFLIITLLQTLPLRRCEGRALKGSQQSAAQAT